MSGIDTTSGGDAGSKNQLRSGVLRGRYRIARLLGRGGMGAVYLATDALFGDQPCAVKELLGDPAATPVEAAEAEERFGREARLLAALEHANLPKVRDYFSEQGHSYLVMEYIAGETLEQRVAREGAQSQQVVLGWAQELCAALDYLHAQTPPIIFRDVAPDNIMVDAAGHIKLIDFGIARVFNPTKQTDTLRFGKVGYAPPEQFSGRGQTTQRSDLFALGATLHFALTGRDPADLPFVFPPLRETNPSVSAEVEQAILGAVQMDPAKRPADVRAFAEGLELTLPTLVLPVYPSGLLVEVSSLPSRPAQQEQRLVVFRQRDLSTTRPGQARLRGSIPLLVVVGTFLCIFTIMFYVSLVNGNSSFADVFPIFGSTLPMMVMGFSVAIFSQFFKRGDQKRGRIALGRQGVLLLQVRPYLRRKEIPWEDMLAVENNIQLYGPRVELRLRLKKQMSPFAQALSKFLYTEAVQIRENRANASMAQWQMATATVSTPIMTPWSVSLAPWAYEQLAADQSPVPAMNLQEALLWYWQEPQRRAALADLPAQGQEREIALLQEAADLRAPVTRWIGPPAWASLGLLVMSIVLTTPLHLWAYPGQMALYPAWPGLNGSSLASLGFYSVGLALLLARANRRGWFFKVGAAAVIVGGVIQMIGGLGAAFSLPNYELPNPYFPYSQDMVGTFFLPAILSVMVFFALPVLAEKREAGRNYTGGEILLWSALPFIIILASLLRDVMLAVYPATQQIGDAALLDLAMLPYMPLLILPLCYFQGRSLPVRRWTTLGVFVCGLALTIGAPILYLTTSAWASLADWPGMNLLALNGYWGLNLLAGVLIMGTAAIKLHLLSPERAVFAALGADAHQAITSVTAVFNRRRVTLPPGKAD